jgi:single-strand DNA-binding protein
MPSVNKAILIGHAGKDAEKKYLANGTLTIKFSLATTENFKDKDGQWQDKTEWHNVVMFGDRNDYVADSVKKGNLIYVEGKTTHRQWTKDDGSQGYMTEVVADRVKNFTRKEDSAPDAQPEATGGLEMNEDDELMGALGGSGK